MHERLKFFRTTLKLTQKDFAEKIEIDQRNYTNYENGKAELKAKHIQKLIENFKINANWLITGKGEILIKENESGQQISGNKNIGINNSTISVTRSNDKEMQEILQDLYSLPDNKRKKIYHLIKAELTEL